ALLNKPLCFHTFRPQSWRCQLLHTSHLRANVDTANFHFYEVGNVNIQYILEFETCGPGSFFFSRFSCLPAASQRTRRRHSAWSTHSSSKPNVSTKTVRRSAKLSRDTRAICRSASPARCSRGSWTSELRSSKAIRWPRSTPRTTR